MKWIDTVFRLSLWAASLLFVARFANERTDQFTLWRIASNRPYHEEYATRPLTSEESSDLEKALAQPYTYFASGGQAFAFFSADRNYVVKFFKQRLYNRSKLLNFVPLPKFLHRYRNMRNSKRDDKFARDFFSYKISFEELQEETGVFYVHLNTTDHLKTQLQITDRLGINHLLDLDKMDFIVQKRAEKIHDRIIRLMEIGKTSEAKQAIGQVVDLITTRASKGFRDRDPNVRTNCGFLGDRAIKIDVGRFVRCPEMQTKERHNADLLQITAPFEEWLEEHYPELRPTLETYREGALL